MAADTCILLENIGALIYHTRWCLHDYSDDECVVILKNQVEAMAPDSKLLIGEIVMSNPPKQSAVTMDMLLGTIGGKERTIEGFHDLAFRAGLRITSVHSGPRDMAIMECEKL
jgi:hypothetical protein